MEPSASHVTKYYKDVLVIMYIAVGIKKLLKTSKLEIIVRRGGSFVGLVPCERHYVESFTRSYLPCVNSDTVSMISKITVLTIFDHVTIS